MLMEAISKDGGGEMWASPHEIEKEKKKERKKKKKIETSLCVHEFCHGLLCVLNKLVCMCG